MPLLPWKKKPRSARISGLLADLHAPPRRGGSLVVQTGFPTSLIDLFVKNRDRLKKPPKRTSAKHSRGRARHPDAAATSAPIIDPPRAADPPQFREDGPPGAEELPCTDGDDRLRRPESGDDEDAVDEAAPPVPASRETPAFGKGSADRVPLAVLTVFAVVALALCTKGLAVGITIPAVLLLFLEHTGIVIPRLWKHWRSDDALSPRYKRRSFVFEGTEKCRLLSEAEEKEVVIERCNSIETVTGAEAVPGQGVDSVGPDPEPRVLIQDRRPSRSSEAEAETSPASQGAKKKPKVLKRIAMRKKPRNTKKGETVESRS